MDIFSKTRRSSRLISAVLALTLALVWSLTAAMSDASPAISWALHSCRYSGSTPTVEIKFNNVQNLNANAVKTARIKWNAVASPVTFVQNNSSSDPELDVYDQSYSSTNAWAWIDYGEHDCSSGSGGPGTWDNNETDLHINNSTFNARTKREKWIISVHELGHALGLDHSALTCISGPAVMRQGTAKFSCGGAGAPPWSNDVSGANAAY